MLTLRIPTQLAGADFVTLHDAGGNRTSCGLSMRNPIADSQSPQVSPQASPQAWMDSIPEDIDFLIAWSGTLDADLFGRDTPMNWLGPGQTALTAFLTAVSPLLI